MVISSLKIFSKFSTKWKILKRKDSASKDWIQSQEIISILFQLSSVQFVRIPVIFSIPQGFHCWAFFSKAAWSTEALSILSWCWCFVEEEMCSSAVAVTSAFVRFQVTLGQLSKIAEVPSAKWWELRFLRALKYLNHGTGRLTTSQGLICGSD